MRRRDFLKIAPIGAVAAIVVPAVLAQDKEPRHSQKDKLVLKVGNTTIATTTPTTLDLSEQDAQFIESRQFKIEEIARAFNYPVEIMNSTPISKLQGDG
jgi:phage portal protein BeeE